MPAVVLDVDNGVDDALALLLAARHPEAARGRVHRRQRRPRHGGPQHPGRAGRWSAASASRSCAVPRRPLTRAGTAGGLAARTGRAGGAGPCGGRGDGRPAQPGDAAARRGRRGVAGAARAAGVCAPALRTNPAAVRGLNGVLAAAGPAAGGPEFNADHDPVAGAEVRAAVRRERLPLREGPVEAGRQARAPAVPPSATPRRPGAGRPAGGERRRPRRRRGAGDLLPSGAGLGLRGARP